jgi:hypothetical protein
MAEAQAARQTLRELENELKLPPAQRRDRAGTA